MERHHGNGGGRLRMKPSCSVCLNNVWRYRQQAKNNRFSLAASENIHEISAAYGVSA